MVPSEYSQSSPQSSNGYKDGMIFPDLMTTVNNSNNSVYGAKQFT